MLLECWKQHLNLYPITGTRPSGCPWLPKYRAAISSSKTKLPSLSWKVLPSVFEQPVGGLEATVHNCPEGAGRPVPQVKKVDGPCRSRRFKSPFSLFRHRRFPQGSTLNITATPPVHCPQNVPKTFCGYLSPRNSKSCKPLSYGSLHLARATGLEPETTGSTVQDSWYSGTFQPRISVCLRANVSRSIIEGIDWRRTVVDVDQRLSMA
jgi:hypothetical protein